MDGREPDLWRDGIDVAVVKRAARQAGRNAVEMPLLHEIVFPVCAPSLLDGKLRLRSPGDLVPHTLIECDSAEIDDPEFTWSTWLDTVRVAARAPSTRQLRFSHFGWPCRRRWMGLASPSGDRRWSMRSWLRAGWCGRSPEESWPRRPNVFALTWRDTGAVRQDQRIAAFRDFALDEACGCELAAGPCGMPASERDARTRAGWLAGRAARRAMVASRA